MLDPIHHREPITEFISCPVCCKIFNDTLQRPMSLACGHTVCKSCLQGRLGNERCPFDQEPFPVDAEKLQPNYALMQVVEATNIKNSTEDELPGSEYPKCYEVARQCLNEISVYLKPLAENSSDDEGSLHTPPSPQQITDKAQTKCLLSRPLQRKVISLIQCQVVEEEGRSRAARIARSIGERIVSELLSGQQYPHQLSANLWAAVRARGCQFLGPAMQEEALKLILLTLENGCMLSRKVLVLYVVGKLSSTYPHASKTAIGHVVQLLYRASCFKVAKRDEESSLMQLKEEFREYEALRKEHDAQIVQIAMEAGLRIPPEQWSSLLYGDLTHKSHMQSIMDKLQNPLSFSQCVLELIQVLQRNGDPGGFLKLRHRFEFLSCIDPSPDAQVPSMQDIKAIMQSLNMVMKAFISFQSLPSPRLQSESQAVPNARYKTSMCRDILAKGVCPRGNTCTFAHSQEESERHRLRSRRSMNKVGLKVDGGNGGKQQGSDVEGQMANLHLDPNKPSFISDAQSCVPNGDQSMAKTVNNPPQIKEFSNQSAPTDNWLPVDGLTNGFAAPPVTVQGVNPVNKNAISIPPPIPNFPATLLTFSQPAEEAPGTPFFPRMGLQTSFHPHNMRGPPPPFIPSMPNAPHGFSPNNRMGYAPPPVNPAHHPDHVPAHAPPQSSLLHTTPTPNPQHVVTADHSNTNNTTLGGTKQLSETAVEVERSSVTNGMNLPLENGSGFSISPEAAVNCGNCHPNARSSTHSFGGPDGALQSLTHGIQSVLPPPQTPVIPALLVDASKQPIFLPPPIGITGSPHHPPPPPHTATFPPVQYMATPYLPTANNLVVWVPEGASISSDTVTMVEEPAVAWLEEDENGSV